MTQMPTYPYIYSYIHKLCNIYIYIYIIDSDESCDFHSCDNELYHLRDRVPFLAITDTVFNSLWSSDAIW